MFKLILNIIQSVHVLKLYTERTSLIFFVFMYLLKINFKNVKQKEKKKEKENKRESQAAVMRVHSLNVYSQESNFTSNSIVPHLITLKCTLLILLSFTW